MSNKIIFRMVAWTDAAGKYNPEAPLNGNEDNYYVDDNLGDAFPNHVIADEDIELSDCGVIMAVADGMGGMNAGEVASQIAHDAVADFFAPGKVTPRLAATHDERSCYMEKVIREADRRIKDVARSNKECEGMGSTLIMAWLAGDELSVTWIGDSRAYLFNRKTGIRPLSKDHSYVQELADKGIISYEQTFEHPQGNIVTRSLGDESQKARPESRLFKVNDGDIILLCSDGLSGVLRDRKACDENGEPYSGDNMEDIIRENSSSLKKCREALWSAAEQAGWYDNVTAILCEIRSGAGTHFGTECDGKTEVAPYSLQESRLNKTFDGFVIKIPRKNFLILLMLLLLVIASVGYSLFFYKRILVRQDAPVMTDSSKFIQPADTGCRVETHVISGKRHAEPIVSKEKNVKQTAKEERKTVSLPSKSVGKMLSTDKLTKVARQGKDSLTKIGHTIDGLTPITGKTK